MMKPRLHRKKFSTLFVLTILLNGVLPFSTYAVPQAGSDWVWQEVSPPEGLTPEARTNGTAIYDPIDRRLIIFGGTGESGLLNDLWAFDIDANSWSPLAATGTPPAPRRGHNAIYDPVGHQMVVWAGQQGSRFFNDTWTLNLTTLEWRDVSPTTRPVSRYGSAAIFDPLSRALVQFAGFTSESRRFQDTQAFHLSVNTWEDLTPDGIKPQIRCLHTAAYDPMSRRMIMYGGQRSGPLDDLWAFDLDSRTWTELTSETRPAGRFWSTSFVDRDGTFIIFGGRTIAGNVNETWAFNFETSQWRRIEIANTPSPRNGMMSIYIEDENRFIIFGGSGDGLLNDVWELRQL